MKLKIPYSVRIPRFYKWLFRDAEFRIVNKGKKVFLTFDDGPHPEATSFVLSILAEQNVKATFFVLGKNVVQYPEITRKIVQEGHLVANHGYDHLDGWKTSNKKYLEDVLKGKEASASRIFRPPYGRLSYFQYLALKRTERIVFWDVISGDFDTTISGKDVFYNVVKNVRNGSIIIMHDSAKSLTNVKSSLLQIIKELKKDGYEFDTP